MMTAPMTETSEGLFEPLSHDEEVLDALNHDDPARAAELLRVGKPIGRLVLRALADMLDGDAVKKPELRYRYAYRLDQASWGKPGPRPKQAAAKNTAKLKGDAELIHVLTHCAPAVAAQLLRKRKRAGSTFVTALADLLDGDARQKASLLLAYPCRLKLVQWNLRGRKPKDIQASAKSNPRYDRKLPPRRSHQLIKSNGKTPAQVSRASARPSDAMLASMVERLVDKGWSRAEAIKRVIRIITRISGKRIIVSESLVGKAYDRYRGRIFRSASLPTSDPRVRS